MMPTTLTPMDSDRHAAIRAVLLHEVDTSAKTGQAPDVAQPRPVRRRVVWMLPAAGALAAAAVLASVLGQTPPSGAAWSAVPTPPTAQEREAAGQQCRDFHLDQLAEPAAEQPPVADVVNSTVVLAERRGPWLFALLTGPDGLVLDCLLPDDPEALIANGTEDVSLSTGGGGTHHVQPVPPESQEIEPVRWSATYVDTGGYSTLTGRAGEDITAITVATPDNRRVTATLENGYWAAWWPVDPDTARDAFPTVTATLADGTHTEPIPFDQLYTESELP